jgi:hypothetical protein
MENMGLSWKKGSKIEAPCSFHDGILLHEAGTNIEDDHILRNKLGILERIPLRFFGTVSLYKIL